MSRLTTKLWRDLRLSRWQFAAVGVTVGLGIGFFYGALNSYYNLGSSYGLNYRRLAFADATVAMKRAPEDIVKRIARIPGVRSAIGRLTEEVDIEQAGRGSTHVIGRLISMPAAQQPAVNRIHIVRGRYFLPQARREVILESSFAKAHGYRIGERIYPIVGGERVPFRIVGIAQSPEYVYAIRSEQYLVPTPDTFGVMFIPHRQAELLLDMSGLVNQVCVIADPDRLDSILQSLGRVTERYGGEEPLPREEQPSYKMLKMDLDGYKTMAVIFPCLFLGAAVLATYTLLARMVQAQRAQIGFLRASGFSSRAVLVHFLGFALAVGVVGGILGVLLGHWFSVWILQLYMELINISFVDSQNRPLLMLAALAVAILACFVGALAPARAAALLQPAAAIRDEISAAPLARGAVRRTRFKVPSVLRLPVRNLLRRPRRTLYTALGAASGISLVIVSLSLSDSMDESIRLYFDELVLYDFAAYFVPPQSDRVVSFIQQWEGVRRAEPTLEIPVEIARGDKKHSTILGGLAPDSRLQRLLDVSGRRAVPGAGALLVGDVVRKKFGVEAGDTLRVDYAQNTRELKVTRSLHVGRRIQQVVGSVVYLRIGEVRRMFENALSLPAGAMSGVLVKAEPGHEARIRSRLYRLPGVAAVETRAHIQEQLRELTAFSYAFSGVMALFGVSMAFAITFNTMSINVMERARELATLRSLGFPFRRIVAMTTVEGLLTSLMGIAIGMPSGRLLSEYIMRSFESETLSMRAVVSSQTYLAAAVGMLVVALVAQIPSLRYVRRMDLAKATKERSG